jgi:AAA domain/Bifunctional DNA primase/polymerase, N-terminal
MPSVLAAALDYAAHGLAVLPVRGKRPCVLWREASTTDAATIERWFTTDYPDAGVAIDTGKSALVVVDLDVKNGHDGVAAWSALDAPATFRARTPSGGEHWYYREHPRTVVGNGASVLAPGVDVRGLGGYVVAPPSTTDAGAYRWSEGEPAWDTLPVVPDVVVRATREREPNHAEPVNQSPAGVPAAPDAVLARVKALASELGAATDGEGNTTAAAIAFKVGQYVGAGQVDAGTAVGVLLAAVRRWHYSDPGDRRGMERTIRAQVKAGAKQPRPWVDTNVAEPVAEPSAVDVLLARMLDRDALDAIPAPVPLIRDVLDMDSESWIIGAPGGFKSFVALDWACHVATGLAWRGKPVTRGQVVYVAAEGSKSIPLRVRAWEDTYGQRAEGVRFLPEPVQVADMFAWRVLVAACERIGPVLVVLDTQARITVGLDENSNGAMGALTEAVRVLKEATGACVLVVHHIGRNGLDARGASAIDGAQDTEIRVERPPSRGDRASMTATISIDKQKDGDESAAWPVRMRVVELGVDAATGRALSSLACEPLDPFDEPARPLPDWIANLTERQAEVLEVLHEHSDAYGATGAQVQKWIAEHRAIRGVTEKMPRGTFDSAVKALIEKDLVERIGARIMVVKS